MLIDVLHTDVCITQLIEYYITKQDERQTTHKICENHHAHKRVAYTCNLYKDLQSVLRDYAKLKSAAYQWSGRTSQSLTNSTANHENIQVVENQS